MSFYPCRQCGAAEAYLTSDGGERFCSDTCEAVWVKAGGQYGEGYRAALEAVKAEIAAMPYIRGIGEVSEDLLARIARLEKEQG